MIIILILIIMIRKANDVYKLKVIIGAPL